MRIRQPSRCSQRRCGASAVELAILLPLLVTLALTSVDFGRFAYAYIAVGNSARVGAEHGAIGRHDAANDAAWRSDVEAVAREEFVAVGGLQPADLAIDIQVVSETAELHRVTVTATYPFWTVVDWPLIPRPLSLSRSVAVRRFR